MKNNYSFSKDDILVKDHDVSFSIILSHVDLTAVKHIIHLTYNDEESFYRARRYSAIKYDIKSLPLD